MFVFFGLYLLKIFPVMKKKITMDLDDSNVMFFFREIILALYLCS